MNGDGEAGDYETSQSYLRGEFVTGIETYDFSPIGYLPDVSLGFGIIPGLDFSALNPMPSVLVVDTDSGPTPEDVLPEPAVSYEPAEVVVIDPDSQESVTVYETQSEVAAEFERIKAAYESVDWDEFYRRATQDSGIEFPVPQGPFDPPGGWGGGEVAIDWGAIITTGVEQYFAPDTPSNFYYPSGGVPANGNGNGMPAKVTVDTKTGKVTTCKRRRRRRLLTEGDFNDLMRIATLPNKDTVKVALAKAVGRR